MRFQRFFYLEFLILRFPYMLLADWNPVSESGFNRCAPRYIRKNSRENSIFLRFFLRLGASRLLFINLRFSKSCTIFCSQPSTELFWYHTQLIVLSIEKVHFKVFLISECFVFISVFLTIVQLYIYIIYIYIYTYIYIYLCTHTHTYIYCIYW